MKITTLASIHARDAARLHIAGQPGTFLTSLGPEVLTVFYRALPQSPTGIGFALQGEPSESRQQPTGKQQVPSAPIAGFVAATTCTGCLFLELGTRHLWQFLPPLLARLARQPQLLGRSIQTLFYPFLSKHHTPATPSQGKPAAVAELLSIMVAPSLRSQGLGAQLIDQLVTACQARTLDAIDVTVDASNSGARRFYAHHGFGEEETFSLYGRPMMRYRLPLLPKVQAQ